MSNRLFSDVDMEEELPQRRIEGGVTSDEDDESGDDNDGPSKQ